ncbi:MAG: hypothetical protein J7577_06690 [Sphingobacteriaceae bacterium]|nr:hypothetical protein [Sphingobacteriaceae bacterium]
MKKQTKFRIAIASGIVLIFVAAITSCKKNQKETEIPKVEESGLSKVDQISIAKAGFSPTNAIKTDGGFIVEGDIFLKTTDLERQQTFIKKVVSKEATTEQYRTTNQVTGLPRVIKIKVNAGTAQTVFTNATKEAIKRYNDLGLKLTFTLLDSNSITKEDILIKGESFSDPNVLGQSAGFPDANGNPASPIKLSNTHYDKNFTNNNLLATVIAHEIGHAIGFRHTDYADRTYSCGLTPWDAFLRLFGIQVGNEGDGGVGAIHIPGTPLGGEPGSWMLACSDGSNRPFTASDIVAIKALYPKTN